MKVLLLNIFLILLVFSLNAQQDSIIKQSDGLYCDINLEPQFPGGNVALKRYLSDHLKYPAECIPENFSGKCYVAFVILKDGSTTQVEIIRGDPDCPEFEKHVIELIEQMPKWQPATLNGKPISAPFQLPIRIRLHPD